jgi:Peptidase family M13
MTSTAVAVPPALAKLVSAVRVVVHDHPDWDQTALASDPHEVVRLGRWPHLERHPQRRERRKKLEWMGADTRRRALDKPGKFTPKIGYPDRWRDYSSLRIDPADLMADVRAAHAFEFHRQLNNIGKPIDRDEWHMTPQTVNAYYNAGMNEIVFPAAILQDPFFNPDRDDAANYGAIGAIIGHEIGHGFHDQGSKYDGEGRLTDWWGATDRQAFETRTRSRATLPSGPARVRHVEVTGVAPPGSACGNLAASDPAAARSRRRGSPRRHGRSPRRRTGATRSR